MSKHHLIKRTLAAGAVIAAAGFPSAAQAMYFGGRGGSVPVTPPVVVSHASQTVLGPTDASSGGYDFAASAAPATAQSGSGFHWNDAGIGAGAAVLLLGTAALAAGLTRRRRSAALS